MYVGDLVPKDKWNLAYALLFLEGLGLLFPWNVFITAKSYFQYRVCGTSFEHNFENFFGIVFNISNVLSLIVALKVQHKIPVRKRAAAPLILNTLVFLVVLILVMVPPDVLGGDLFFAITLICVAISGFCTAFLQGGVFGLAGLLPPMYMQAVMGGNGLAGVMVSVSSVLSQAIGAPPSSNESECDAPMRPYDEVKWPAFAYFLVSVVVLTLCVFGYIVLVKLPFVRHFIDAHAPTTRYEALEDDVEGSRTSPGIHDTPLLTTANGNADALEQQEISAWGVFQKIKSDALSVFLVFWLTLMLFPSVTAYITSTKLPAGPGLNGTLAAAVPVPVPFSMLAAPTPAPVPINRFFSDLFVPISFLNFNLFDFIGRISAGLITVKLNGCKWLWCPSILRFAFIPLFLLCNTAGQHNAIFNEDAYPIVFMVLFALSNGFLSSVLMMYGPSRVRPEEMALAGTMMALFLTCGLTAGSLTSFALIPLVHPNL